LNDRRSGFAFDLVADRLKQVGFAQSGIPIDKQWIISIARRLAYCYAACVGEPIAGADDKILKGIIGVKGGPVFLFLFGGLLFDLAIGGKLHADKVARYLLRGAGKRDSAFTLQKLCARLIRAADLERPARQPHQVEVFKPFTGVDGIESPRTVEYFSEDIFNFTAGQDVFLYKSANGGQNDATINKGYPLQTTSVLLKQRLRQAHRKPKTLYHPLQLYDDHP